MILCFAAKFAFFSAACGEVDRLDGSSGVGGGAGTGGIVDGTGGNSPVSLCDDTAGYRLLHFVVPAADTVRLTIKARNGHPFLHVLGDCSYLARAGDLDYEWVVKGQLSADEAAQLAEDLELGELETLNGTVAHSPGSHQPRSTLVFEGSRVACDFDCVGPSYDNVMDQTAHAALSPIFEKLVSWRNELVERGEPLGGNVRVAAIAVGADIARFGTVAQWPLQQSPLDFLIPSTEIPTGLQQLSGSDAMALRTMQDSLEPFPGGMKPIEFEGNYYDVVVDDVLPGEVNDWNILPK